MPFVNTEIRNDIIESFPTLLNKGDKKKEEYQGFVIYQISRNIL